MDVSFKLLRRLWLSYSTVDWVSTGWVSREQLGI